MLSWPRFSTAIFVTLSSGHRRRYIRRQGGAGLHGYFIALNALFDKALFIFPSVKTSDAQISSSDLGLAVK
jgi:hypothetical protein